MLLCFPSGACRAFDIHTEDFQSGPPFSLSESAQSLFLFCYYIHQCVSLPISSASYPPFLFFPPSRPPPDTLLDSMIHGRRLRVAEDVLCPYKLSTSTKEG